MTKSERLQEQLKMERAAQRHRQYVEKMRLERAARASAGQRLEERRDEQRAALREELVTRRFSGQQRWRQETEAARQTAETLRAQQAERHAAERRAIEDERQRREERRQEWVSRRLEERQRLEARQIRVETPQPQRSEQRGADHKALENEAGRRAQPRERLGTPQVKKGQRSRTEGGAWREPIAPSRAQEATGQAGEPALSRRGRMERGVPEAARARLEWLRQQQAERRGADRRALQAERLGRIQPRQSSGSQRVKEHERLRAGTEASKGQPLAVRAHRSTPRSGERRKARGAPNVTRGQVKTLQRQQSVRRSEARQAFYEQRAARVHLREKLGGQRVEEHRQLRAGVEASKQKVAALRAKEAARRTEERMPLAAFTGRTGGPTMAAASSPAPPEQPFEGLLWLRTAESFVVNENGAAVNLRGITVQGLDSVAPASDQSLAGSLSLDDANLSTITDLWGFNLVRLPFRAQTILSGNGSLSANDLLAGLDDAVTVLSGSGVYTLLSLLGPTPQDATTALPDQQVFDCWNLLSQHYEEESAVLFEIYNSAIPISRGWLEAAQVLIGSIRRQHPASLLFVGNGSGGADTGGLPLLFSTGDPTPNIVYTIRVAPQPQLSIDEENSLAALTSSFPVFASDWSDSGAFEFDRSAELAANVFSRYGIGWAASSWNAEPRLVVDAATHHLGATRWGLAVQRAMTLPAKEPLTMLLPGATEGG